MEPSEGEERTTRWKWKSWRSQLLKVKREEGRMSQHLLLILISPVGASHWLNSTENLPAQKSGTQSSEVTLGTWQDREAQRVDEINLSTFYFIYTIQNIIISTCELHKNYYDDILHFLGTKSSNLACILHCQCILAQTSHILGAQQPYVVSGYWRIQF